MISQAQAITRELTLRDRLSRLTFTQACRLPGEDGAHFTRSGAKKENDVDQQVYPRVDPFQLKLINGHRDYM